MIPQLILAVALVLVYNFWWKRRGLPSGPTPFPLFGNLPQLCISGRWDRQFAQWGKEFNGLYTYWFGPQPTVVIADYDLAVEILVKNSDASSTRGINDHFNDACREGTLGIVLTSGDLWKEQRSFVLKVLRQFGMGTNLMQEKVLVELSDIVSGLDREIAAGTEEVDVAHFTELAVGSVIQSVLFGYRFQEENRAEFEMLKRLTFGLVAQTSDPFTAAAIMNAQVAQLPIFRSRLARFVAMFHELNAFVDENIQQHLKVLDKDREPTDFIDSFLLEMKRLEGSGKPNYFSIKQLRSTLIDCWFAGQETSASTLSWVFAFLIAHPEVQQKVHEELDRVIGDERIITMDDRFRLPYLNAVILESQRCGNVVVQNVLRVLTRDVHVQGRTLKKGTYICPQVSAMLWDEKRWPEPEKFKVERFLGEDGQLRNTEAMVAFSLGKRICPGENLAKMELFLFTANLLNRFKFEQGAKAVQLERDGGGIATAIKPFTCRVSRRVR